MRSRDAVPAAAIAAACVALWLAPPPKPLADDGGEILRAEVTEVDDSGISRAGLLDYGTQHLRVRLVDGKEKGRELAAENELRAQLDIDKKFKAGDTCIVTWPENGIPEGGTAMARDHWRLGRAGWIFGGFCALLVAFGGWTGAKALFSFVLSCFAVWKLLIPLCLNGWSASWTAFALVSLLTAAIMYLVAGTTRRGIAAFAGAMLGVAASLVLAHAFSAALKVNGATMPFAQALMYSGLESLDLADVFAGASILAASGALMDLAMDISAGVDEVAAHNPALSARALFASGLRIGRSVTGTMTTTLLLAYSGGYLTLLMVFAAQGTPPVAFLNSTLVSAEMVKTLVGSFGLVLVAPATALVAATVQTFRRPRRI